MSSPAVVRSTWLCTGPLGRALVADLATLTESEVFKIGRRRRLAFGVRADLTASAARAGRCPSDQRLSRLRWGRVELREGEGLRSSCQ